MNLAQKGKLMLSVLCQGEPVKLGFPRCSQESIVREVAQRLTNELGVVVELTVGSMNLCNFTAYPWLNRNLVSECIINLQREHPEMVMTINDRYISFQE